MKALRKLKPGYGAELVDIPIPSIEADEVLIKVKATALCKSDIDVYNWTPLVASANYRLPLTMGHEFLGEIVEVGNAVRTLKVGEHVVGETHVPCLRCKSCWNNNMHICDNMGVLGRSYQGSFAEYIKMPAVSAINVSKDLPPKYGAVMEPLATAVHALMKGQVWGKPVVVLGCGVIGLMSVQLAKLLGATRVYAVSTSLNKLEKAVALGADKAINSRTEDWVQIILDETHGYGVGTAIETTGNEGIINRTMDVLQKAGTCVFVGMIEGGLNIEKYMDRVVERGQVFNGVLSRRNY